LPGTQLDGLNKVVFLIDTGFDWGDPNKPMEDSCSAAGVVRSRRFSRRSVRSVRRSSRRSCRPVRRYRAFRCVDQAGKLDQRIITYRLP